MSGWDWDRRIPVALIVTMVIQTFSILVVGTAWVTQTNSRLEAVEKWMRDNESISKKVLTLEEQNHYRDNQISELRSTDQATASALRDLQAQINSMFGRMPNNR